MHRTLIRCCSWRTLAVVLAALCCLLSAGCRQELYSSLSEQDVNEMLVALLGEGVDAAKTPSADGKAWALEVEQSQMVHAMDVLRARALPRRQYEDLGELFKKDGLVSTPTEERVRFIYGVSQELSSTLSRIDGVMVARVHIVLPNNDPLAAAARPSSASIFIKYQPGSDITSLIPQIKSLVVHSVEGLSYDQVSVTAVVAAPPAPPPVREAHDVNGQALWLYGGLALAALTVLLGLLFWWITRVARGLPDVPLADRLMFWRLRDRTAGQV